MKSPFVRSPYNYDMEVASLMHATVPYGEDLTIQSEKDECDINVIARRFGVTGHMPQNVRAPLVGDFSNVGDFQSAMNAINSAEDAFMQMPAELRAQLGHDAGRFVDWCSDDKNKDAMRKYGLLRPGEEPIIAPVVPPPAT